MFCASLAKRLSKITLTKEYKEKQIFKNFIKNHSLVVELIFRCFGKSRRATQFKLLPSNCYKFLIFATFSLF